MAITKLNIPTIRSNIKTILDNNNTTTSSVIDLSSDMSKRVLRVADVNPELFMLQATQYPAVTIWTEKKTPTFGPIAAGPSNVKRRGDVFINIAGMVYNQNFASNIYTDQAQNDLEHLMENIEAILRNDVTLNSQVKWDIAEDVNYYLLRMSEETNFRVGTLGLKVTCFY